MIIITEFQMETIHIIILWFEITSGTIRAQSTTIYTDSELNVSFVAHLSKILTHVHPKKQQKTILDSKTNQSVIKVAKGGFDPPTFGL